MSASKEQSGAVSSPVTESNPAVEQEENVPVAQGAHMHDREMPAEPGGGGEQEQDEVHTNNVPNSANAAGAKKIFGTMRRPNPTAKKGNDAYNYEEKYPEDAVYEEASPNARVWRTYEDESRIHDANMVEESRDNVDVLLVFAGLFSAVVTTFVAQTYQNLQANYTAMSASLLFELVLVQRAIANGSTVNSITPSPLNPSILFVPTITDVWVNGLWFTSLFLSLTAALVAVLVKQWLHHYVALPSGTPRDRSLTRQFRYAGFQKWHVQIIIGLLPVLMHLALAIFLVGLVVFLHPLQEALSWTICAGTLLVYAAYVTATILPILFPQCPYRTPLCDLIYMSFWHIVPRVSWYKKKHFLIACRRGKLGYMFSSLPHIQARNPQSLTITESVSVQHTSTNLAAEALDWLFSASSNPSVQSVVAQAVGGLPRASREIFELQPSIPRIRDVQGSLLRICLQEDEDHPSYHKPVRGMELKLERLLRFQPYYLRYITALDVDAIELTAAIQCNYDHHWLVGRGPSVWHHPATFLKDVVHRSTKLPPLCWSRLVTLAKEVNAFGALDPDNDNNTDMFPLDLCSAVLRSFGSSQSGLKQDFTSPLALEFSEAVCYFPEKIYDNVLSMLPKFARSPPSVQSSLLKPLRVFVAAVEFSIHRLSLPESDMSHTTIRLSLRSALQCIKLQQTSSLRVAAVIPVLEDILAAAIIQHPRNIQSPWNQVCHDAVLAYSRTFMISPSTCSVRGLRSVVDFMTIDWDQPRSHIYQSDVACWAMSSLLAARIPAAYDVFLDSQCLEFFGSHAFHTISSFEVLAEYVCGISELHGVMDAATVQQHVNQLHEPHNLFTACSILATYGVQTHTQARTEIRNAITALALLRQEEHVGTWNECRRKLHDLTDNDDGEFFTRQRIAVSLSFSRELEAEEIQIEKDNIRYAIKELDALFDEAEHGAISSALVSTRPPMGCMNRLLGWCIGRKPEDKLEQVQQV
ncbi:uncharacterized protein ARMOST_08300 [Armillaria ostoyae]|uniref:DUF6535 domain-containing protein n=1 Tax=Armillaria ostoyae TaxID=47428 RepID=A0A284R8A1_ARMOS|nr:uncharacterized protein ARMOST_08300 [Armillaria ostoyae]